MRWVGLLFVVGCYGPVDVEWTASFANDSDDAEADFVFVDVRWDPGVLSCPGELDDIVRGPYQIRPEASAGTIPSLESQEYCFHATALRSDCTLVAEGWLALEVPRDEVHVVMSSASGGGCNPGASCVNGRCVRDDGGPTCALTQAYCSEFNICCPGSNEEQACRFFDEVTVGCSDPL